MLLPLTKKIRNAEGGVFLFVYLEGIYIKFIFFNILNVRYL